MADVQPYVLRYWETEFPALSPGKSGGGQRLYSQREIDVILRIKELLYKEGFTIAGAKKKLEGELDETQTIVRGVALPAEASSPPRAASPHADRLLRDVRNELRAILRMLEE